MMLWMGSHQKFIEYISVDEKNYICMTKNLQYLFVFIIRICVLNSTNLPVIKHIVSFIFYMSPIKWQRLPD